MSPVSAARRDAAGALAARLRETCLGEWRVEHASVVDQEVQSCDSFARQLLHNRVDGAAGALDASARVSAPRKPPGAPAARLAGARASASEVPSAEQRAAASGAPEA